MAETLSQNEIDALLSALNAQTGPAPAESSAPAPTPASLAAGSEPAPRMGGGGGGGSLPAAALLEIDKPKKGKIYDFKRQTKFSKEQLRTIQMIHEGFTRHLSTYLSTTLRAYAQATIVSVDQLTFEEFIRSIFSPTFITVFHSEKLDGKGIMDMNLNVVFAILDRLLGGNGTPLDTPRQLTEIEGSVMERIMVRVLTLLREAWINVVDLTPRLDFIESNPQFAQIVPPNDMALAIGIEIKIQEVTGLMNLCMPYATVEAIAPKLNAASWFAAIRKEPLTTNVDLLTKQMQVVSLPIIAELGTATLTLQDLLGLQVGDLILTDRLIKEDLDVRVGNRVKFKARPGILGKKMAIAVTEVVAKTEEDIL